MSYTPNELSFSRLISYLVFGLQCKPKAGEAEINSAQNKNALTLKPVRFYKKFN